MPLVAVTPVSAAPDDAAYVSPNKAGGSFSIVPCGRHANKPSSTQNESDPCSICHLAVLGSNIVK